MTALWNDATNCVKSQERTDQNHGWYRTIALEEGGKRLAIITAHLIVDTNTKIVNSCKSQCEWNCMKVKKAKDVRAEIFRELKKIRQAQSTCVIAVGCFNECVCSKTMQEFMVEMGFHDALSEVHGIKKKTDMECSSMVQIMWTLCQCQNKFQKQQKAQS